MRAQLDPDHWCNGGEYGSSHPDALAMEALDAENKQLREELEQLRQVVRRFYEHSAIAPSAL